MTSAHIKLPAPPADKIWVCVGCGSRLGKMHWPHCLGAGGRVWPSDALVAVWPSQIHTQSD